MKTYIWIPFADSTRGLTLRRVQTHAELDICSFDLKQNGRTGLAMYYPPDKFGDDMVCGFCFRVLIYTYTRTYRVDKRPN